MEAFYGIDVTEIEGFDDLHRPEGILRGMMERAQGLFGAETYLLVNGSTCGILAAVCAALHRGGTLLMARNCHLSVYHAAYLNACKTVYVNPPYVEEYGICGSIPPEAIRRRLEEDPGINGVLVTSPTYDGVVSDVETIVKEAHRRKIPVIVDAAHGAHFFLDERFPRSAVSCGADLVIHSIHKTLPALTQTALLHVQGELIDRERLRRFLRIYQTSSPSYILMAGIGQCISILEREGKELCGRFFERRRAFDERISGLRALKALTGRESAALREQIFGFDEGKILVSARGTDMTGRELYLRLIKRYQIQMEMSGWEYVLAIMTIMDRKEGFARLADALLETDREIKKAEPRRPFLMETQPKTAFSLSEALEKETQEKPLEDCEGEIAGEFVYVYPPGIPVIAPGEYFTKEIVEGLLLCRRQGLALNGLRVHNRIAVVIKKA